MQYMYIQRQKSKYLVQNVERSVYLEVSSDFVNGICASPILCAVLLDSIKLHM
jgi:hypothetical protein